MRHVSLPSQPLDCPHATPEYVLWQCCLCGLHLTCTLAPPQRRFVSIHASIPAVIAARKALTVPRAAVVLSIACAVVGQQVSAAVATCSTSQQTLHSPVATLGGQCVDFRGVVLSPACV